MTKKKKLTTNSQEKSSSDNFQKSFSDTIQLTNGTKIRFKQLGEKFATIESHFFTYLSQYNIPTAYKNQTDNSTIQFIEYEYLPLELRVLNNADSRISELFTVDEGSELRVPIVEYFIESQPNQMVSESHIIAFDVCSVNTLKLMNRIISKVNAVLKFYFERRSATLTELTMKFGLSGEKALLTGSLTPQSLKVISSDSRMKGIDPFVLETSRDFKKYTDYLYELTNS